MEEYFKDAIVVRGGEERMFWHLLINCKNEEFFKDNIESINKHLGMNVKTFKQYQKIMKARNI